MGPLESLSEPDHSWRPWALDRPRSPFYCAGVEIIVDTREKLPWTFSGQDVQLTTKELETGDYSLPGLEHAVTIERKSIDDWVGTVMQARQRFYLELKRMRSYDFRCVIIESGVREIMEGSYRSNSKPESVLAFIAEVSVGQAVPVYLAGTRAEAQILAGAFLRIAVKKLTAAGR